MKIYLTSFHRASDGALELLRGKLIDNDMLTTSISKADYVMAIGDREETYDVVLKAYKKHIPIIHLWAGEITEWEVDNDVYRHSMTLMSDIQLCTNDEARRRVESLCKAADKRSSSYTIGNIMLDNLKIDESEVPTCGYDLVLYNPPNRLSYKVIKKEIREILSKVGDTYIWIEPNGDRGSKLVNKYVTTKSLDRPIFLGLMKNCNKFLNIVTPLLF